MPDTMSVERRNLIKAYGATVVLSKGSEGMKGAIEKANEMFNEGYTLKQINNKCEIWAYVPEHLENINKDNCFKISYWQCCDKPAYQIIRICFDGDVTVGGCGSWSGYYSDRIRIDSRDLKNPRPKEELFIDPRYEELYGY